MNMQRNILTCRQGPRQLNATYLSTLFGWAITITQHGGGNIAVSITKVIPAQDATGNGLTDAGQLSMAYQYKTQAIDMTKNGTLVAHLSNKYAMGHNKTAEQH